MKQIRPEPMSRLADRLPDALIDERKLVDGMPHFVNEDREHVFDFDDDMRLAITRMGNEFHVIAAPAGGPVFSRGTTTDEIVDFIVEKIKDVGLLDIIGQSDITVNLKQGNYMHLILQEGDGCINVVREQLTMTSETSYGEK